MNPVLHPDFLRLPIAHRGLHAAAQGRMENSRAAVHAAVEAGYAIEIDVQLSADGHAMVFHDATVDRMTAHSGAVRGFDADTLGRMLLCGSDEGIPTLREICALVGGRVPLLVELKDQAGAPGPKGHALEYATADALAGYPGPVAVMSFSPWMIVEMADRLPDVPRGLVTCAFDHPDSLVLPDPVLAQLRSIALYERAGACFISHDVRDLSAPAVTRIAALGGHVLCWTVTNTAAEAHARAIAANITFEHYLPEIPG